MEKILTIVIPTYNMEQYIARCLDSLLIQENFDKLDILVVNDGSQDKSSEIAHRYQNNYPGSIRVIDKENGNYGSCINRGLKEAKGKYIKILDSDDYFDKYSFQVFVNTLWSSDEDMILTDFNIEEENALTRNISVPFIEPYKTLYFKDVNIGYFNMHSVAYKTEILRQMNYTQTEGISYTDQEWVFYPILFVDTLKYLKYPVYQYQIGREGQTMNPNVYLRSILHEIIVAKRMLEYVETLDLSFLSAAHAKFINNRLCDRVQLIYKVLLLKMPDHLYDSNLMLDFDTFVKEHSTTIYDYLNQSVLRRLLPIKYIKVWRNTKRRLPLFIRKYC